MRCSSSSYASSSSSSSSSPHGASSRGLSSLSSRSHVIEDDCHYDESEMEMSFNFDQLVTFSSTTKTRPQATEYCYSDNEDEQEEEEVHQYRVFSEVASSLLGAPMARVSSWVGPRRAVRVLASHGFEPLPQSSKPQQPSSPNSHTNSFEAHAVNADDGLLVVPDAALDARFRQHADVQRAGVRFCAAVAVVSPRDGSRLGAVCVMDTSPRPHGLCEEELTTLQEVAAEVADLMEKRQDLRAMEERSWASAPTTTSSSLEAPPSATRPTNVGNFLRLLELLAVSFAKRVSVYLSVEGSVPETLTFNEAEAFGSALAVLKSACDGTDSGYIHLRMSLKAAADGTGHCLVFECESTAAPEDGHDTASTSSAPSSTTPPPPPLPCLPVIANYMNSVGGRCGAQTRDAPHQRRGSLVWFSLPVAA